MIDPATININELVAALLGDGDTEPGHWWKKDCEFVTQERNGKPILVVFHPPTKRYLRHSKGPVQGHAWDMYGDDYMKPAWALLALSQAPAPGMLRP